MKLPWRMIFLVGAVVSVPWSGSVCAQGSWTPVPRLSSARWVAAATTGGDGRLYVIGGVDARAVPIALVEAYEPEAMTWTRQADLPTARATQVATGLDGKIYAFGGQRALSEGSYYGVSDAVDVYDPATGCWSSRAPMPTARYGLAAVTGLDGRIYTFGGSRGGFNGERVVNTVEIYDPDTDTWTTGAPMLSAKSSFGGALGCDGRIYLVGGRAPPRYFLTDVDVYNPETNCWTSVRPMPTGRYNLGVVAAGGRIYAFGGFAGFQYTAVMEVYDPAEDTWRSAPPMSSVREGPAAALGSDGRIYALGGNSGFGALDSGEAFQLYPDG